MGESKKTVSLIAMYTLTLQKTVVRGWWECTDLEFT